MTELEAREAAHGAKDAVRFAEDLTQVRAVPDAEGDRIEIEAVVLERQCLGVALRPRDI